MAVENGNLVLTLTGGAIEGTVLTVPIAAVPRLAGMSEDELRDVKFLSGGLVLWWAAKTSIFTPTR